MRGLSQFVITFGRVISTGQVPRIFLTYRTINMPRMTKPKKICTDLSFVFQEGHLLSNHFIIGEIYLFHCCNPQCPPESSLWGVIDRQDNKNIYLESSSFDLHNFTMWHLLPIVYNYCRKASRSELRDYVAALSFKESRDFKDTNKN